MSDEARPIDVFIFERHVAVREGVKAMLNGSPLNVVSESASIDDLTERLESIDVGVMLVGDSSADVVLDALDAIIDHNADASIVVYCGDDTTETIRAFYEHGARGFVNSAAGREFVLEALQQVAGGEYFFMPGHAERLLIAQFRGATDPFEVLTPGEMKLYVKLAEEKESIQQIAADLGLTEKAVRNRSVTIRHKLGIPRKQFARYARKHKLI